MNVAEGRADIDGSERMASTSATPGDELADELAHSVEFTPLPKNAGVDAAVSAARRVINALLHAGDHSAAEMGQVADGLNKVAAHLEEHAPPVEERMANMWAGEGFNRHNPVTGPENALAPPLHLRAKPDGSVIGVTSLGLQYQGPPGNVHGGIAALLLDDALGVANFSAGEPGMTAQLSLRYRRPTPLFEPLIVRAHQVSVDGRKIRTVGTISAGDQVCVEAEGLFIAMKLPGGP
jgi:acyl-coenzyme A thioesterase PaaI-like protein